MKAVVIIGMLLSAIFLADNIHTVASDSYVEVDVTVNKIKYYDNIAECYEDDGTLYRVDLDIKDSLQNGDVIKLYKSCNVVLPSISGFPDKSSARATSICLGAVCGVLFISFLVVLVFSGGLNNGRRKRLVISQEI